MCSHRLTIKISVCLIILKNLNVLKALVSHLSVKGVWLIGAAMSSFLCRWLTRTFMGSWALSCSYELVATLLTTKERRSNEMEVEKVYS